ncbi:hypothetical protein PMAYCL1PPCAC_20028, partial [Pristionchus mayeri]
SNVLAQWKNSTRILFIPVPNITIQRLLVLLGAETSVSVGELDVQGSGALDDGLSLLGGDGVGDLSAVPLVVHEEHVEVLGVVDENLLESVGKHVTDVLGVSVTDVGHQSLSLEAATDTVINTLGFAPVGLDTVVSARLMPGEATSVLLGKAKLLSRDEDHYL